MTNEDKSWGEWRKEYREYCDRVAHEKYSGKFSFAGITIEYVGWKRDVEVLGWTEEQNKAHGPMVELISDNHKMGCGCDKTLDMAKRKLAESIVLNQDSSLALMKSDKEAWREWLEGIKKEEIVDL